MVKLKFQFAQKNATLLIQEIVESTKQCKLPFISQQSKNPLIFYNQVVYNTFLIRSALKKSFTLDNFLLTFALKRKLRLFSEQMFQEHFNSSDKRELKELRRNLKVIEFFVEDFFYYEYRKRPNWHILYEDIYFESLSIEEAKETGQIFEGLFDELVTLNAGNAEKIQLAVKKALQGN